MRSKPAIAVEVVTRSELLELSEVEARYAWQTYRRLYNKAMRLEGAFMAALADFVGTQ